MALFTVTNFFDFGTGSLRNAINMANSMAGPDTIEFSNSLSGGTIGLSSGQLSITDSLAINGLGANLLAVDAQRLGFRAFNINDGTASIIDVSISGLTITGGQATGGLCNPSFPAPNPFPLDGGGICNLENLTLADSTVSGNSAGGRGWGGGILNVGKVTITNSTISDNSALVGGGILNVGKVTITNSTISGNSAEAGGGIATSGTATITNSTISGNSAEAVGGGILMGSGATTTITNSTISGNSAAQGRNNGGGIDTGGTATITNTIIANSLNGGDCRGTIATNINNLIEDGSCNPLLSGDPNLGPLQNNGGPTATHALLPGSIAINAGSNAGVPPGVTTDQRGPGFARIVNGTVDIGAFEVQPVQPVPESSPTLGLLALLILGCGLLVRRKLLAKSTG